MSQGVTVKKPILSSSWGLFAVMYAGITIYIAIMACWHAYCFTRVLRSGFYIDALRRHFEELKITNYSMENVKKYWGPRANRWTSALLDNDGYYWKTKYKALLSAAIANSFMGCNRLAFKAATSALKLQPGSINTMEFLAGFYRELGIAEREKACRMASMMVNHANLEADIWSKIEICAGD